MPLGFARNLFTYYDDLWSPQLSLGTDLRMWLNPSDLTTVTFSGSNELTAISDASNVGTSVNINNTPFKVFAESKVVIGFAHASNEFLSTGSFAIASGGNHWALFAGEINAPNNSKDSIWSFDTASSPARDYAISASDASEFQGELDLDGLSSNRISSNAGNLIDFTSGVNGASNPKIDPDTPFMCVCFFNKTGSEIGVRINGSNAFNPETDYDNAIQTTAGMNIFRNRGSQSYGGQLWEFMVSQGLPGSGGTDMTKIEQAEGYIAHKWNMTALLPGSHPYKSVAPTA